jgi:hypothetical protein
MAARTISGVACSTAGGQVAASTQAGFAIPTNAAKKTKRIDSDKVTADSRQNGLGKKDAVFFSCLLLSI